MRPKRYAIKEIFGTLQGEGSNAGTPSVFLRFAGCNLGYAVCPWCDTDWAKAELDLECDQIASHINQVARKTFGQQGGGLLVVVTGGEPSLQFDQALSQTLRSNGYRIAMETNGSRPLDLSLVDWLTVSPKEPEYVQKFGNELKVVYTGKDGTGVSPSVEAVRALSRDTSFDHYFLQPLDLPEHGPNFSETAQAVMELGPPWRMSIQTHKVAGLK
jgi:7-carboxy-7-deazaguanine synthase